MFLNQPLLLSSALVHQMLLNQRLIHPNKWCDRSSHKTGFSKFADHRSLRRQFTENWDETVALRRERLCG
jgi:hypothetical protein